MDKTPVISHTTIVIWQGFMKTILFKYNTVGTYFCNLPTGIPDNRNWLYPCSKIYSYTAIDDNIILIVTCYRDWRDRRGKILVESILYQRNFFFFSIKYSKMLSNDFWHRKLLTFNENNMTHNEVTIRILRSNASFRCDFAETDDGRELPTVRRNVDWLTLRRHSSDFTPSRGNIAVSAADAHCRRRWLLPLRSTIIIEYEQFWRAREKNYFRSFYLTLTEFPRLPLVIIIP